MNWKVTAEGTVAGRAQEGPPVGETAARTERRGRECREMDGGVFVINARAHYDAAHYLRHHTGKCRRLHGHRYVVEVALQATTLNEAGLAYDFADLKGHLRGLAERLDHRNLNEIPPFTEIESSAENQARWFFQELRALLPEELREGLLFARVWESPDQWAQYGPSPAVLSPPGPLHP